MLEVMVALLVLSIGLLGLAMLQVRGMQFNSDAYIRTQATMYAYDIMDRIRANWSAATNDSNPVYRMPSPPSSTITDCATNACSASALAAYDLYRWYSALSKAIPLNPGAATTIAYAAGGQYTITINWIERDLPIRQTWIVEPSTYGH